MTHISGELIDGIDPAYGDGDTLSMTDGNSRLFDASAYMADGEIKMTAAEEVLAHLLINVIGAVDDRNYTPNEAQQIIEHALLHPVQGWRPTHRHKKRGSEYMLLGIGKMQAGNWREYDPESGAYYDADMQEVAIYRAEDDGSYWVRPREEFDDGRFEALPSAPAGGSGA